MTRLLRLSAAAVLLTSAAYLTACNTNHDPEQVGTESRTTRMSTHDNPDSSGYATDSAASTVE